MLIRKRHKICFLFFYFKWTADVHASSFATFPHTIQGLGISLLLLLLFVYFFLSLSFYYLKSDTYSACIHLRAYTGRLMIKTHPVKLKKKKINAVLCLAAKERKIWNNFFFFFQLLMIIMQWKIDINVKPCSSSYFNYYYSFFFIYP